VPQAEVGEDLGADAVVALLQHVDAFRQPNQKVLNAGEIYVVSDPQNHGSYSTRGGIQSTPTSGADMGNSTRGWFMTEPFSLVLANPRSVVKGKRI